MKKSVSEFWSMVSHGVAVEAEFKGSWIWAERSNGNLMTRGVDPGMDQISHPTINMETLRNLRLTKLSGFE